MNSIGRSSIRFYSLFFVIFFFFCISLWFHWVSLVYICKYWQNSFTVHTIRSAQTLKHKTVWHRASAQFWHHSVAYNNNNSSACKVTMNANNSNNKMTTTKKWTEEKPSNWISQFKRIISCLAWSVPHKTKQTRCHQNLTRIS